MRTMKFMEGLSKVTYNSCRFNSTFT